MLTLLVALVVCVEWGPVLTAPGECDHGAFEINGKKVPFDACTQLQNWPTVVGSGNELNITMYYTTRAKDLLVGVNVTGGSRMLGSLNTFPYYFAFAYGALMSGSCATILYSGSDPQSKWEVAGLNISGVQLIHSWPRWDDVWISDWPAKLLEQELIASNKRSLTSTTLLQFSVPLKPPCGFGIGAGIVPVIWSASKDFPVLTDQPTAVVPHQFYGYGTLEVVRSSLPSEPSRRPKPTPSSSLSPIPVPSKAPEECKYGKFVINGKIISFDSCTQLKNWPGIVGSGLDITLHYMTEGSDLFVGVNITGGSGLSGSLNALPYYFSFAYGSLMAGSCATILFGGNSPQSKWEIAGLNIGAQRIHYPYPLWNDLLIRHWPSQLIDQEFVTSSKSNVPSTTLLHFSVPLNPPCGSVAAGQTPVIWSSSKVSPLKTGETGRVTFHEFYGYGIIEVPKLLTTSSMNASVPPLTPPPSSHPPLTEQPTMSTTPSPGKLPTASPSLAISDAPSFEPSPSAAISTTETEITSTISIISSSPKISHPATNYASPVPASPSPSASSVLCSASCDFGFEGYMIGSVPSFALGQDADTNFTPRIVSLNSSARIVSLNSSAPRVGVVGGSEEALIITSSETMRPISSFDASNLTQPFSPTFFKCIAGGVAHESAHGNQIEALQGACIILPLSNIQLIDEQYQVIANIAYSVSSKACVLFTVTDK